MYSPVFSRYRLSFWTGILLVFLSSTAFAQSVDQPDEMMRKTTNEILELIRTNKPAYEADRDKLFTMVDQKVLPYFDFRKMSQLVLALNWRSATEKQRNDFTNEFKQLLVRTYAVALLKYTDQKLVYLPYTGKPTDTTVLVKVNITQGGGAPDIPFFTRFYNGKDGWKVIDITIEGVSLVTNYRKVYDQTIKTDGLDALIASLANSNRKARADQVSNK
jgi:phospholipid transport system substrate-binding protein